MGMEKIDRKAALLQMLQKEMELRTKIELEVIQLIRNGEHEKAGELLQTIDDGIIRGILKKLNELDIDFEIPEE